MSRPRVGEESEEFRAAALDDLAFDLSLVANRTYMLKETSVNAEHRAQATEAIKQGGIKAAFASFIQILLVGLQHRAAVAAQGAGDGGQGLVLVTGAGPGHGAGGRAGLLAKTLHVLLDIHSSQS